MHAAEWIAVITPVLGLVTTGIVGVFKLVRSVDRVGDHLSMVVDQVKDHEQRLRSGGL